MNRSKDKGFGRGGRDGSREVENEVEEEEEDLADIDGRGGQEKGRNTVAKASRTSSPAPSSDARPK